MLVLNLIHASKNGFQLESILKQNALIRYIHVLLLLSVLLKQPIMYDSK